MILLLGLAVTPPVTLTIDDGSPIAAAFSTCVPAGCIVPIAAASKTLDAMRAGSALTIVVQDLDRQRLQLPVSLIEFSAAIIRLEELTQLYRHSLRLGIRFLSAHPADKGYDQEFPVG